MPVTEATQGLPLGDCVGVVTHHSGFSLATFGQVPEKTALASAPVIDSVVAPVQTAGILVLTISLPTTDADGGALAQSEIVKIRMHHSTNSGVDIFDAYVDFPPGETLQWGPGDTATHYIAVRVQDSHDNWSALSNEESGAANAAASTEPEDDGLWAHRLGVGAIWTEDSPDTDSISWASVILYWKNHKYTIADGNTDKKYLWWDYSLSTTSFQTSATAPTLTFEDVIVAYNDHGKLYVTMYSPMVIADFLRAGILQSTNWAAAVGSQFDLDNGTIQLGGSIAPKFSVDTDGLMTSKAGEVAGFTISATEGLYAGAAATRVQMQAGVGFWAGATLFADAPFRANQAGAVVCDNITVNGGVIGGFTPDPVEGIYVGTGVTRVQMKPGVGIWAGATLFADAPFSVTKAGTLISTDATITGTLTATAGVIGGFTIDATEGIYVGAVATRIQMKVGTGLWLGATEYTDAPFKVSPAGALTATSGAIAGFTLSVSDGLYAGAVATRVQMKPGAGFWAGATAIGDAPFSVTEAGVLVASSGTVGGCVLGSTAIGSTVFVSGPLGSGWQISNAGTVELQDALIRGILHAVVFEKDTISAVNGLMLITKADALSSDMTAADASTVTITGETTFVANEIIRIKDGTDDEWMLVTNVGSAPTYTVTRDLAGDYGADANPIWTAGTAIVSMGVGTGDKTGFVLIDSSSANSPFIDIYGRNSNTYTDYTLHGRFGWLKGVIDADVGLSSTDVWGLYTDNAYIKGVIVAATGYIGGTSGWTIATGKMTASGIGLATAAGDATYAFWAGNDTPADAEFSVTHAGALAATSGAIGGWTLGATTLVGGDLTMDAGNTKITAGTGDAIIVIDAADANYRIVVGNAVYTDAPFSVQKDGSFYLGGAAGNLQWSPSPASLLVTAIYASAGAGIERIEIDGTTLEAIDASNNTRIEFLSTDISLFDATPTQIAYIPTTSGVTRITNPWFAHAQVTIDKKLVVGSTAINNPSEALHVTGDQKLTGSLDVGTNLNVDGYIEVGDRSTPTTARVVGIVYGTGAAPTASTTPIGTLFVKYTA